MNRLPLVDPEHTTAELGATFQHGAYVTAQILAVDGGVSGI